ncbi:MAG: prolipoprotein diacylglyceryl transferase [Alphaproteobacteria bacterium]|nr:prolipoprotein diacylglyceryl transferase [Alphaproteobacteria bacterium]HPF47890.1 prolipoprotein diacylglyceryl transferase [Emcibacteraceae bacterium]HRW29999.1 prolipoprotein diacylglyceryl transferase [Emcibacteraceae bacterium]
MIEYLFSAALTYPNIDPILVQFGPIAIRWYSLAYLGGLIFGWYYVSRLIRIKPAPCTQEQVSDFVFWAMMGIIFGGRLGYVLFYNLPFYLSNPGKIIAVWDGGMSFHGGFLGVCISTILYCRKHKIPLFRFADLIACASPIGLMFGRFANFVNGELYGRVTDAPIGMVFPHGGPLPRHPSQLYEAVLEGFVLFFILFFVFHFTKARHKPGMITGLFIIGYALARTFVEQFREPDSQLGFLFGTHSLTMGQTLSVPMILFGLYLIFRPRTSAL